MSDIKLLSFEVELCRYGENKGNYECKAKFQHGKNNFQIIVSENLGELLVHACKGEIAKASTSALEQLTILAREQSVEEE